MEKRKRRKRRKEEDEFVSYLMEWVMEHEMELIGRYLQNGNLMNCRDCGRHIFLCDCPAF